MPTSSGLVISGGEIRTVSSGNIFVSTTIADGTLNISYGGVASYTKMSAGIISVGGKAISVSAAGGVVSAVSGGTLSGATLTGGASLRIHSKGAVSKLSLRGATAEMYTGGRISGAVVSNASLYIQGGIALNTKIVSATVAISGGSAKDATVKNSGLLSACGNAKLTSITVQSGGTFVMGTDPGINPKLTSAYFSSGATLKFYGGSATSANGAAKGVNITFETNSGANVFKGNINGSKLVYSNGVLKNLVTYGGKLRMRNGSASNITLISGYGDIKSSGVVINGLLLKGKHYYDVGNGSSVPDWFCVAGGLVSKVTVSKAYMRIDEGKVISAVIKSGGTATARHHDYDLTCPVVSRVFISKGGLMNVSSGAKVVSATLYSGKMSLYAGAVLKGAVNIKAGVISVNGTVKTSASITIDLTKRTAKSSYAITGLSKLGLSATNSSTWLRISISGSQANGTYKLASGASAYKGSIIIYRNGKKLTTLGGKFAKTYSKDGKKYAYSISSNGYATLKISSKSAIGAAAESIGRYANQTLASVQTDLLVCSSGTCAGATLA